MNKQIESHDGDSSKQLWCMRCALENKSPLFSMLCMPIALTPRHADAPELFFPSIYIRVLFLLLHRLAHLLLDILSRNQRDDHDKQLLLRLSVLEHISKLMRPG